MLFSLLPGRQNRSRRRRQNQDAGVHALKQVAHFDVEKDWDTFRMREAYNAHLRLREAPISVLEVEKVSS